MAKLFHFPSLFDDVLAAPTTAPEPVIAPSEPQHTSADGELPPDWRERAHALDIRRSWIVEAPAGSGKTGLLIQRLLKLLADETVLQPEQVLAITFTRAATEEIRDRVLAQLEDAAAHTPATTPFDRATRELALALLERNARLGWDLRSNSRRLNIRTIDSVCTQIMGALPVLSGGAGHLRPTEDAGPIYREAVRHVLLRLGGSDEALHHALSTLLTRRDGSVANCEQLLVEMLASREQWGDLIPLGRPALEDDELDREVLPRLNLALEQVICAELTRLQTALPEPFLQQLTEAAAELSDRPGYREDPSPIAVCRNHYNTPEARTADLELWRALLHLLVTPKGQNWRNGFNSNQLGITLDRAEKARLQELVSTARQTPGLLTIIQRASRLPPAQYPNEQWHVVKALFFVLRAALAELQLAFARHGVCDFSEAALQARAALRDAAGAGDLRSALGFEIQHLLVDEMQDTSSGQYELLELLTEHWPGERRTLFLVGDPKQSIYMFRQARVERFLQTMRERRLGTLAVLPLRLTANFRSEARLVESANQSFSRIFPSAAPAHDDAAIPFTPAHPTRPARPEPPEHKSIEWRLSVLPPATGEVALTEIRKRDATAIREIILRWRARPLPPGRTRPWSIAVLVRARQHLLEVVAALRDTLGQPAIPYRAVNVEPLGDRPEVLDLLALTRTVLHPADRVAYLSLLRAPWCGLAQAELHLLAGADDPAFSRLPVETLLDLRAPLLNTGSRQRVEHLRRVLRAAEEQRNEIPLAQLVERTWRSLGGHLALPSDGRENCVRFFRLLDELEESIGRVDLGRLSAEVNRLFAEHSAAEDAVDLMTIHQAKGLEWDLVLIPALDRDTRQGATRLLTWEELTGTSSEAAHTLLAPIQGRGQPSEALNLWLNSLAREREAEERKRLFYVACTRAREELHLFGAVETRQSGELATPRRGSLLAAAWPAALPHLASQPSTAPVLIKFPQPDAAGLSIAASAEPEQPPPAIYRLPDNINRLTGEFAMSPPPEPVPTPRQHHTAPRPEANLATRALGNAVHTLLDLLAQELAAGQPVEDLLQQLPAWRSRTVALLRSAGISPRELPPLTRNVELALSNTLTDPVGLWILRPRSHAANEFARTLWREQAPQTIRIDRLFLAGKKPLSELDAPSDAAACLWLVDYKTATHGRGELQEFLMQQRLSYAEQLETYARALDGYAGSITTRVALYFPMLRELVWWQPPTQIRLADSAS